MDRAKNGQRITSPQERLADAKVRLVTEAGKVDPLKPLREHPWTAIGSAIALGAVAGAIAESVRSRPQPMIVAAVDNSVAQPSLPADTKSKLLLALQPLLMRGIHLMASWWIARRQAAHAAQASTTSSAESNE